MLRSKYSRRKRKRLHLGEYRQFGFHVIIKMDEKAGIDMQSGELIDIVDEIIDVLEEKNLSCGGGGDDKYCSYYVCPAGRKMDIGIDHKAKEVKEKLLTLHGVDKVEISDLSDCWHVTDADWKKLDEWETNTKARLDEKD